MSMSMSHSMSMISTNEKCHFCMYSMSDPDLVLVPPRRMEEASDYAHTLTVDDAIMCPAVLAAEAVCCPVGVTDDPVTASVVTDAPEAGSVDVHSTPAPVTSALTEYPTHAPVTPAPVTDAPTTDPPVATSVDEAHAPTLVPITPAPVTPAPVTPAPVTDAPTSHSPTKSPPVAATDVPVVTPVITDTPHIMSMSMSHSMSIATKVSCEVGPMWQSLI